MNQRSPAPRVLIYSGGMDSFTLLHVQLAKGHDVWPLSFNYGQRHYRELEHAKEVCKRLDINHKHQIIQMESFAGLVRGASALTGGNEVPEGHYAEENMKQTVVPNRNMVMLSIATAYAISIGADRVLTGVHAGDHDIYPDCRTDFIASMDATVKLANYDQIDIRAPFQTLTKGGILNRGQKQAGLEAKDYLLAWTCYKGEIQPCGKCGACVERLEAFHEMGWEDPLPYLDKNYYKEVLNLA